MGWYVFALIDAAPPGPPGKGLTGALVIRPLGRAFAAIERRADVPPAEFGTLKRHQAVVKRLAGRVPAILPVRFGTLLEPEELEEAVRERDEDIEEAFERVRGRMQFTWRRTTAPRGRASGAGRAGGPRDMAASGAAYLRRAARASRPVPPASWKPLRTRLAPLVAAERYQPGAGAVPDSLYHLVAREDAIQYAAVASALRRSNPLFTMTGPWPPFAFAPEVL